MWIRRHHLCGRRRVRCVRRRAANCTRPYWIWWYQPEWNGLQSERDDQSTAAVSVIQSDVNDGYAYYDALDVNLSHQFSQRLTVLASYVWSHAIDNVDPDLPSQNPNDPNFTGKVENGNAIFDQRQRFVLSGNLPAALEDQFWRVGTFGSGLPYNYTTV